MRRHSNALREFADGQHRPCALAFRFAVIGHRPVPGQPPATRARIVWLARKVITRRGRMGTSTPVLGLRPIRCALSRSTKVPKPEIFTFCPSDSASDICDRIDSTIIADSLRDSPICWLIRAAISALVSVPAVISSLPLLTRQPKPVPGRPPPSRVPNRCVTKAKKSAKLKWMDGEVDATSPFPDAKATPILDAQPSPAPGEAAAHRPQPDTRARFAPPAPYPKAQPHRPP